MKTVIIDRFDGGIVPNKRHVRENAAVSMKRFDTARTQTLRPYRDLVVDTPTEGDLDNSGITKMTLINGIVYGFGYVSAAVQRAQVWKKTTTDVTSVWTIVTNATSASGGARNTALFLYYKNQDTIYGANTNGIWSYTVAGDTFTHNENTSVIPSGQGIVHSKDDIIYIPCGNVIASNNAGSWNNNAFAGLPSDYASNSVAELGNLLVIGGNRTRGGVIYFWDRDSSVNDAVESAELGEQTIKWIANIGGSIVACCTRVDVTTGFDELVFYEVNGAKPREIESYNTGSSGTTVVLNETQQYGDSVQFLMDLTVDGTLYAGLWSFTKNFDGTFRFEFITPPRNDTTVTTGKLKGHFRTNGFHLISYLNENDGGKYTLWRSAQSFLGTAQWNTTIDPNMGADKSRKKQLMAVALYYEPLPVNAQAELYCRVDGGSYTKILTEATTGAVATETTVDINGDNFAVGREYEFRIESTIGAVITRFDYTYKTLSTLI